ncbi:MAG TPA: cyclic nucleotide-binding domain-containing protein [Candidatus Limnocylindrales bacterium]|nr:cyclic nucleotide-binding domain-containing protein [Candidatus Limnocylindrales bacterium]
MAIFNYKTKEVIGKIVYYGPGLGGKTTSLQYIHEHVIPERRGELFFLATEDDQTIYFELLPLQVGKVQDFNLRFQVYTVPGQVKYNNTRKAVLQGVDAIVFVADSQRARRKTNILGLENLKFNLAGYNRRLEDIPLVFQYNKRDLDGILTLEELNRDLNPGNLPYFESVAREGKGVLEAFEVISSLAVQNIETRLRQTQGKSPLSTSTTSQGTLAPSQQEFSDYILGDDKEGLWGSTKGIDLLLSSDSDPLPCAYYQDGDIIFEKGDPGDKMYYIESGKVEIVQWGELEKEVLAVYQKGDFFGEMALFADKPRSITAIARGFTQVQVMTKETLSDYIHKKPEIALALIKTLSNRIQGSNQTIGKLTDKNKELSQRLNQAYKIIKQLTQENKILKGLL